MHICANSARAVEQTAPFAHIAAELIAVAARINSHRDASSSSATIKKSCHSTFSWETPSQGAMPDACHGAGARGIILWDAELLQCMWRHVQHYQIQLSGSSPDMEKLMDELGMTCTTGRLDGLTHPVATIIKACMMQSACLKLSIFTAAWPSLNVMMQYSCRLRYSVLVLPPRQWLGTGTLAGLHPPQRYRQAVWAKYSQMR